MVLWGRSNVGPCSRGTVGRRNLGAVEMFGGEVVGPWGRGAMVSWCRGSVVVDLGTIAEHVALCVRSLRFVADNLLTNPHWTPWGDYQ